jgi:hypothetical protein
MTAVKTILIPLFLVLVLTGCSNDTPTRKTVVQTRPTSKPPDENAALDALRKINDAQSTYFKVNRRFALTFDELVEARLLRSEPSGAETGYDFKLRPAADAQTFKLFVIPTDANSTAATYLFMDQSGVIRAQIGKEATADSPAVK